MWLLLQWRNCLCYQKPCRGISSTILFMSQWHRVGTLLSLPELNAALEFEFLNRKGFNWLASLLKCTVRGVLSLIWLQEAVFQRCVWEKQSTNKVREQPFLWNYLQCTSLQLMLPEEIMAQMGLTHFCTLVKINKKIIQTEVSQKQDKRYQMKNNHYNEKSGKSGNSYSTSVYWYTLCMGVTGSAPRW